MDTEGPDATPRHRARPRLIQVIELAKLYFSCFRISVRKSSKLRVM